MSIRFNTLSVVDKIKRRSTNMDTQKTIDYTSEMGKLTERASLPTFWKPVVGQHRIKLVSEMTPFEFTDEKTQEVQHRVAITIEENGVKFSWTMGRGQTLASAYGQLLDVAVKNGNKLSGKDVIVVVKNNGQKNDYTIL